MLYLGELAAVFASGTYAVNSTLFTIAGRKVGSMVVNRVRLVAASLFLSLGLWILLGVPWPTGAGWERWLYLGSSGVIGLVVGDAFLFQAFIWIGPRISMLMMSLAPIIAALSAWIFLGEGLSRAQILGIGLTLLGVIWVVLDNQGEGKSRPKHYLKGVLFGLGAAAGQGLGVMLAKPGLNGGFSPVSGNFIRMISALAVMGLLTLIQGKAGETVEAVKNTPEALWAIVGGAISGPVLGVTLSLYAVQHTSVGVASTLMSLAPIFLLPVERWLFHQKIGWGAVVGTITAFSGVGLLFVY